MPLKAYGRLIAHEREGVRKDQRKLEGIERAVNLVKGERGEEALQEMLGVTKEREVALMKAKEEVEKREREVERMARKVGTRVLGLSEGRVNAVLGVIK